jgi:hypothetical protein
MAKNSNKKLVLMIVLVVLVVAVVAYAYFGLGGISGAASSAALKAQCSDGIDNDKDGYCDFNYPHKCTDGSKVGDKDCVSKGDNNESSNCAPSKEVCDNRDNDCDGLIDEGLVQQCGVTEVGACEFGTQTCLSGVWGTCSGNIDPRPETCDGILDEDCDGEIDEGCQCFNGQTNTCGVSHIGACIYGTATCFNGTWGDCVGNIDPVIEICNGLDDDCDGQVDENLSTQCGVSNVGACRYGTQACFNGSWQNCIGNIDPTAETCDGIVDQDCDGQVDEGCACTNGQLQNCGSNIGECAFGTQSCLGGVWGACLGDIGPRTEVCDLKDNDCDTAVDEGLFVACSSSGNCGLSGWMGMPYCNGNDVYRYWVNQQCNNAGSCSAYCSNTTNSYLYQTCNGTTTCVNGACQQTSIPDSCSDTDNGRNSTVFGTASGYLNQVYYSNSDACISSITLKEYFCSGTTSSYVYMGCAGNGTINCTSGRCV